jgi:hypothetical protein
MKKVYVRPAIVEYGALKDLVLGGAGLWGDSTAYHQSGNASS